MSAKAVKTVVTAEKTSTINLSQHVNSFLIFKSNYERKRYDKFRSKQFSEGTFITVQFLSTAFAIYYNVRTVIDYPSPLSYCSLVSSLLFPTAVGWLLFAAYYCQLHGSMRIREFCTYRLIPILQPIWAVGVMITVDLFILTTLYNGQCNMETDYIGYGCNHSLKGDMPMLAVQTLFFPIMIFVTVPRIKWEYITAAYIMTVAVMIIAMAIWKLHKPMPGFICFAVLISVGMYEIQRQTICLFLLKERLESTLIENKRLNEETNTNEMRAMIGNTAHDIKTPLASFLGGIEILSTIVNEIKVTLSPSIVSNNIELVASKYDHPILETTNSSKQLTQQLNAMSDCIHNMSNIHTLMLMTINRSIDFATSSNNQPLVPRIETVNFIDTVLASLNCVRNVQGNSDAVEIQLIDHINRKVSVINDGNDNSELSPSSSTLSESKQKHLYVEKSVPNPFRVTMPIIGVPTNSHIVTDKTWLQDNIMCLVSNAVKYSRDLTKKYNNTCVSDEQIVTLSVQLSTEVDIMNCHARKHIEHNNTSDECNNDNYNQAESFKTTVKTNSVSSISTKIRVKPTALIPPLNLSMINPSTALSSKQAMNVIYNTSKNEDHDDVRFTENPRKESMPVLLFEVTDCGETVSEQEMSTIFQVAKQADRNYGGTGLGLYCLAKRVEALGGACGVHPRIDGHHGSVFWFTVPYVTSNVSKRTSLAATPKSTAKHTTVTVVDTESNPLSSVHYGNNISESGSPTVVKNTTPKSVSFGSHNVIYPNDQQGTPLNILLVDDTQTILKMCSKMLMRQGHSVTTAENGEMALEKIANQMLKQCDDNIGDDNESPTSVVDTTINIRVINDSNDNVSGHKMKNDNKPLFDVIIMDFQMPVMDGLECTKIIRANERKQKELNMCRQNTVGTNSSARKYSKAVTFAHNDSVTPFVSQDHEYEIIDVSTKKRTSTKEASQHNQSVFRRLPPKVMSQMTSCGDDNDNDIVDDDNTRNITAMHSGNNHLLIIGVSANSDSQIIADAFEAGIDAFIPKPYTLQSFHDTYQSLIKGTHC